MAHGLPYPFSGRVFIVGAGFSYFLSGGYFPLLKQLGAELSESLPWIQERARKDSALDIERVLTDLDLEMLSLPPDTDRNEELIRQRLEVVRFIVSRLKVNGVSDRQRKIASDICLKLFKPGDFILTFNWDCLIEMLLWEARIWAPYGGYGDMMSIPLHSEVDSLNPFFITILKLHGSVNFVVPTYGGPFLTLYKLSEMFPGITPTASGAPDGDAVPVLSLPTYLKRFGDSRSAGDIWTTATEVMAHAQTLVIIGYSLPIADIMAQMLISFAGKEERLRQIAILTATEQESLSIQIRVRQLADLPHDRYEKGSETYSENVEWGIFGAEDGVGFSKLQDTVAKWPVRNLVPAILQRAASQADLKFALMLRDLGKNETK